MEVKHLPVNSANLGFRWQTARIERGNLGVDTFQDASDQVMVERDDKWHIKQRREEAFFT
jgi:hypothetical protein